MGLKDKASKIDFASLMAPTIPHGEGIANTRSAKTAPGAMLAHANDARSELLRENEDLRSKAALTAELESRLGAAVDELRAWDGAKPVRLLDPERVGRSRFANRHASSFEGEDFERLKREIQEAGGNVQPIKVRPAVGEGIDFEIVFGHRRHEACRQLALPVLSVIDNLDDRTLFVEMDRENRERQDLSPWEQGTMYSHAIEAGLFASIRQLATVLGVDQSNLTKALALAKLPQSVVLAFSSPLDIQLRWAPILNKALEQDEAGILKRASELHADRMGRGPKGVLAYLTGGDLESQPLAKAKPRSFKAGGAKVATLTVDGKGQASVNFLVPLPKAREAELAAFIESFVRSLKLGDGRNGEVPEPR